MAAGIIAGVTAGSLAGKGVAANSVAALLLVLMLLWAASTIYFVARPGPAVVLVKRNDRPSVFKAHAPAFIISVTSAIIGGVIAAFLIKVLKLGGG